MPNTKQCPECSAGYGEDVSFCAKDGRSLVGIMAMASRLCPHCANSVAEDAGQCPYCKARLETVDSPQWLIRDESPLDTRPRVRERNLAPKVMLIAGVALCLTAAALFGRGVLENNDASAARGLLEQKNKELQAKEEQIKTVEAELSKMRQEAAEAAKEAVALKARLEDGEKELRASQQRLSDAKREWDRASPRRPQVEPRNDRRPVERVAAPAGPQNQRPAQPGVYETIRATEVHEQPLQSSRVITRIGGGTRVNVVRGDGEWVEVVSKRGNPSGYILRDHTRSVSASN
jgi:hypothetical protein